MMKLLKKLFVILVCVMMTTPLLHTAVIAEEMPDEYKEYTKDNYWAELNWFHFSQVPDFQAVHK